MQHKGPSRRVPELSFPMLSNAIIARVPTSMCEEIGKGIDTGFGMTLV
jgi:hypothetical protein